MAGKCVAKLTLVTKAAQVTGGPLQRREADTVSQDYGVGCWGHVCREELCLGGDVHGEPQPWPPSALIAL